MELFSVICTTCQSKLKVRDQAVIGQILACPKCQGMVLVQPPADWEAGAAGVSAQAASPIARVATTVVPAAHSSSTFEDAAALLSQPAVATAAPPVAESSEVPLGAPPVEWISPQTRAIRRWVFIGGLATISAVVLIGVATYAISGGNKEITVVPEPAPADVEPPSPWTETVPPATEEKPTEPDKVAANDAPAEETAPSPMIEEPAPVEPAPLPPRPEVVADAGKPLDDDAAPQPLNTFNVEGTLKQFGALIEEKPFEEQPGGEPAPIPEGLETEPAPAPTTDDEPLPRPDARRIDVARRLSDPLEAIEVSGLPLADFLQLLTEMTTLPITLDPTALPAIKSSPEAKISVNLKATKISDVLSAALRPHNLAYVATDRQVVVVPLASSKTQLREIKHEVGDLVKTETEAKVLAEIIHAVVDPATWDDAGGRGTIKVEGTTITIAQTPEAHFATVVLCEKLRLARQQPTRSAYPPSVLALTPKAIAADAILDTPVTMNFVPPTRLMRVADHIHRTTGLRVLIDWRALAEAGWTPEGEVKAGVASQPLSAFLDRLTSRMEIAWRVIDSGTVQLTTHEAMAAQADVEVYSIEVEDTGALLANLQKELGAALFAPAAPGVLRYDSASKALIARLPQPAQRKLLQILSKAK